jgi:hypothetical protein
MSLKKAVQALLDRQVAQTQTIQDVVARVTVLNRSPASLQEFRAVLTVQNDTLSKYNERIVSLERQIALMQADLSEAVELLLSPASVGDITSTNPVSIIEQAVKDAADKGNGFESIPEVK